MEFIRCFGCMEETTGYPCSRCGYDPEKRPAQAYALRPGTILKGKYVVGVLLGQGGFGITYIGWDLVADRKVAIKEYFPSGQVSRNVATGNVLQWYTTDQAHFAQNSGMETFQKEARKMERVATIPQVVNVREVFEENATAYIVMDFVEGETLKDRLKKTGPLSWEEAQKIFLPVVDAMAQVHQAGLIHRDLSPDNLMLQPDGTVRILDLGAAKDLNINSGASSMQVAKGGFSPLEQYTQRGGSGSWTDVYALAATMYYSLTGVLPPAAVDRVSDDPLRWDLPQLTALPKNVQGALQNALVLLQDKRTRTMAEFSDQLTHRTSPSPVPTPPRPKPWKWLVPAIAAVGLVGAIALMSGGKPADTGKTESSGKEKTSQSSVAARRSDDRPADFDNDGEYTAMVSAGTEDVYTLANGAKVELFFDDDDQERCRIFTDEDGDRTFIFTAEYDGEGNITEHRMYDGDGMLQRLDLSQFDSNGKITQKQIYDGSGKLLRAIEWTRDANGRDLSYTEKNGSGDVLESGTSTYDAQGTETYTVEVSDGSKRINHYDSEGNCLDYSRYKANGKREYRGEYSYDSQGRQTELRYYNESDQMSFMYEYQYSGDKLVREIYHSYYSGEDHVSTQEQLYGPRDIRFGEKGDSIDEEIRSINGVYLRRYSKYLGDSEYSGDSINYYNWMGDSSGYISYRKDGSLSYKSENHYDENGYKTGQTSTSYSSYNNTRTVTEYDAENKEISKNVYDSSGTLTSWTEYRYEGNMGWEKTYDASGKLTGSVETQYNDYGDVLVEKTYDEDGELWYTYEYHYDANGVRTGYTSTWNNSWNNTTTVTEYDAAYNKISEKTYDASGKLIKSE